MNPRRRITLTFAAAVLATGTVAVAPLTPVGPDAPVADAAGAPIASLPSDNPANWTPNVQDGQVNTIWQIGNTVLIGGTFTQIADSTLNGGAVYDQAYLAAFDATTGLVDADFDPVLTGEVEAIIPSDDPASFYVAGNFNQVDGVNRRKIARLNVADGSIVTAFKTDGANGRIRDIRLVDGTLYAAGLFTRIEASDRTYIASLDPTTGNITTKLDLTLSGLHNGGVGKVIKIDATPDGDKLLITGNFTSIDGQSRPQVALIDIGNTPATLSPWQTNWYTSTCATVFDSYMRDLDISEDGTYAVISTTGAYRPQPSACDTISRFELTAEVADLDPTWVSATGGDTTYAVEIHDGVVYVGGHMRWVNNPYSADRHGAGGVARPGMGALDQVTGLPFSWNPTRDRGVGLFDYHVTEQGIWAGSDTNRWKNELRMKLAFFPFPGTTVLAPTIGELPGDVYLLGRSGGTTGTPDQSVIYRVNAGGPTLTSVDDGPNWTGDSGSPYLVAGGDLAYTAPSSLATPQNNSAVPKSDLDRAPAALWTTSRNDTSGGSEMQWEFPVAAGDEVTVRLYFANRSPATDNSGDRVFDVSIDGALVLDDLDLSNQAGHDVGTMREFDITSDGTIDIDFARSVSDPLINGIEIIDRDVTPSGTLGEQDELQQLDWDGSTTPGAPTVSTIDVPWRTVRGAFLASASLFTFHLDGSIMRRTFDGDTFGPGTAIDTWSNDFMVDAPTMTGVFFDPDASRIYYTISGSDLLFTKQFVPESGVAHAVKTTIDLSGTQLDASEVRGMFLAGNRLHYADATSGDLYSIGWNSATGLPTGAPTLEESVRDWRGRAMFLTSPAAVNTPPTADAAVVGGTCTENLCEFDGTGSTDNGTIVTYEWDFGDGSLVGTGATTSHAYDVGGSYTVTLTVTDELGAADTDTVVVNPTDPSNLEPLARATASCTDNVCQFDGTASSDPDGTIEGYLWNFKDGNSSALAEPEHTYTASGTYSVELTVTDDDGATATTDVSVTVTVTVPTGPDPSSIVPLAPARLLETRVGPNEKTIDGEFQGDGVVGAGDVVELTVTGRGGVPADADAVMLNVTAVLPIGPGYLTVYPCGSTRPLASTVNYQAGQVVPNAVLAKIGSGGKVCIYTLTDTHIVADVTGYVPDGGSPATLTPARLLETRVGPNEKTIDGQFQGGGIVKAGKIVELTVTGRGNVPSDADAVMLNVTAVLPIGPGYLTVYPCGTTRPLASTVNYQAGQVVPNAVLAKVGTGGKVCIYTLTDTHIVADVTGYVPDGGSPATLTPARLLETRVGPNEKTIDGQFQGGGIVRAGKVVELTVTGRSNVPSDADAVMLNVTAILPTGPGYLTVYPCGTTRPLASTVNYQAGQVVANAALAKVGTGGKVCIYTLTDTHIVVDVTAAS